MTKCLRVIGGVAVGLLTIFLPLAAIRIQAQNSPRGPIVSAYHRADEGPGKMKLLSGYVAGLPAGSTCVDTECGYIWNPQGLTIDYDIGALAGVRVGPVSQEPASENYFWHGEATINGQMVRYAVSGDDKPDSVSLSFPESSANFTASIRSESEIQTFLQMVLTYQGTGYRPSNEANVDWRVLQKDGTPLDGVHASLEPTATAARTDDQGHVRFIGVPPGRYELNVSKAQHNTCDFPPQRRQIKIDPAQIQLRSLVVHCR
jgi:hypothetical protein